MKAAVILIAVVIAAGIAAVAVWITRAPSAKAASNPIAVDVAALKAKAEAGDPEAAYTLAKARVRGDLGLPDYSEAARLFQAAADKGHVEAMVGLAELYTLGQGVTNNPAEALRLYLAAAQQGSVRAMYSLAGLYEEGRGVKKDQTLAARWHQLAAERGMAVAQFNLGQRYELGMGVPTDLIEAYKWLSLAAKNGIGDAGEMKDRLRKKMSRDQTAEGQRRVDGFTLASAAPSLTNGISP